MNILDTTIDKRTSAVLTVEKSISSLVFIIGKEIADMTKEKINIKIQKLSGDSVEITNGLVPLREYLIVNTMKQDAIGCNTRLNLNTQAVIELCEHGGVFLQDKDMIKIELQDLDPKCTYIIDGIEDPSMSNEIYKFERKNVNSEQEVSTFDCVKYDCGVLQDDPNIYEILLHFDNGQSTIHTPRELKALSTDLDPIAQVLLNGTVLQSFDSYLQLPLKGILQLTIRKKQGSTVNFFLRRDLAHHPHAPIHAHNIHAKNFKR